MNTANLQLEGLYVAMAALVEAIRQKGLLDAEEIEAALLRAEEIAPRRSEPMPEANIAAIKFPARLLRVANRAAANGEHLSFEDMTRRVRGVQGAPRQKLTESEYLELAQDQIRDTDA
ncbi:hypothetical protein [Paradevosia shaoguanensis]|uniref:Uncharacterized protein n=1 Tax=Paradevosia shaoguanensis TaxID=1335043 RepID=A0AA41UFX4_9HYPH|nr:hypothetical protein [Paradevosia shaoguanensis]MBI4048700.1 hypothetical protein [Devosia nanyangense]MCF1742338.1 hypothetical protein [Paradevosia shaoguanensis]MCI0126821.1 hypothetical protein [Paradevosia shaoguanensis]CDP54288.1 hypothetical protein [Devosia sp. DBB001]